MPLSIDGTAMVSTIRDPDAMNHPSLSNSSTRVWVKQSAIDAATKKPVKFGASAAGNVMPRSAFKVTSTPAKHFHGSNNNNHASSSHSYSSSTADMTDSSCDNSSISSSIGRVLQWDWKEADLMEQTDQTVTLQLVGTTDNTPISLPSLCLEQGSVVTANPENAAPDDLVTLTHLHEPAVVRSLQLRYASDDIYTCTGPVLLAVNPFTPVRGLYGEAVARQYVQAAERHESVPPHVYRTADASFRSMMRALEMARDQNNGTSDSLSFHGNQSILVSGESGSGKTVTTKFVMKYLAALSQRSVELQKKQDRAFVKAKQTPSSPIRSPEPSRAGAKSWRKKNDGTNSAAMNESGESSTLDGSSIEAQVLQSNPILESFGNARTVRNDNSSRFGKFIEIHFTDTGKLVGAQIETYLLEKVRLVGPGPGERNYHVFYELLSGGLSARELSQYFLASTAGPSDFKCLAGGTTNRRDGVTDRETVGQLLSALRTMSFDASDIQAVLSVAAAILHASNLQFVEDNSGNDDTCVLDGANVHLEPVVKLLGLTHESLEQALCHSTITAGDSTVTRSLSQAQAATGLEALLKETYGALFSYLVQRINKQISGSSSECSSGQTNGAATIGVLDIFGFESFAVNSFEQLCINYCNEALQQQFNAFVLQNEQAEYNREGIDWSFIDFPENQDVLDLMEKRGCSILSILDDQCRAPGPSDKAFCLAVYQQCGKLPRFEASRKQQASLQFSVHHYAGPVEYTVAGFTAKNKDELPKETVLLLGSSEKPLVRELAYLMQASHEDASALATSGDLKTPRKLHRSDSSVGRPTVGGQFRRQLKLLRLKIGRTSPHYIRCLKPNDSLVPDHFDTAIVAEQLKCGGILEAVRVARAGFTQHYTHADFCRRYRALAWSELSKTVMPPSPTNWSQPSATPLRRGFRNSHPLTNRGYLPKPSLPSTPRAAPKAEKEDMSPAEAKTLCKNLIKVLYKKIQQQGVAFSPASGGTANQEPPSPVAKARVYKTPCKAPSWSRSTPSYLPPASPSNASTVKKSNSSPSGSPTRTWKRGTLSSADFAKVGVQMGKTKVFLRHKAFEALERIRSVEQTKAATKLNSLFRRYLARIAYVPYRDQLRLAQGRSRRNLLETCDEYKESKEDDSLDISFGTQNRSFQSIRSYHSGGSFATDSLVDKWTEAQIREAIHNPVPRSEWGKQMPDSGKFQWVIEEGLWVKNYDMLNNSL